jgi:tellurite resistance protein
MAARRNAAGRLAFRRQEGEPRRSMGLFSKFKGGATGSVKQEDCVLLLLGMLLASSSDGQMTDDELKLLEGFFATVPELRGKDFGQMLAEVNKVSAGYPSLGKSIGALGGISSAKVKRKCFILAADIVMASGEVSSEEEKTLAEMQRQLGVADDDARQIVELLAAKYA